MKDSNCTRFLKKHKNTRPYQEDDARVKQPKGQSKRHPVIEELYAIMGKKEPDASIKKGLKYLCANPSDL